MTTPRGDAAVARRLKADAVLEVRAQQIEAGTRGSRDMQPRRTGDGIGDGQPHGQVYLVEHQGHRHVHGQARLFAIESATFRIFGRVDDKQHAIGARHFGRRTPHTFAFDHVV